jgi:AbrB family looped-hinge helix DNA binding protein
MQPTGNSSEVLRAKVDSVGRVLIPANTRQRLGIEQGDEVLIEADDNGVRITTAKQALKQAQAFFAKLANPGESIVDELIRERREEAARE